jgi:hypothetical protein
VLASGAFVLPATTACVGTVLGGWSVGSAIDEALNTDGIECYGKWCLGSMQ